MGCLKSEMERLLRKFLAKFIKVSFIKENNADLTQLPCCSDEAQLPDLIAVGMSARSYLAKKGKTYLLLLHQDFSCKQFYICMHIPSLKCNDCQ